MDLSLVKDMDYFAEIKMDLQDILQDLRDLNESEAEHTQHHSVSSEQVDLLKGQITFLAKRILILHHAQADMQEKVDRILAQGNVNGMSVHERFSSTASENSNPSKPPIIMTCEESADSGCLVSSCSKFQSEPNLEHDDSTENSVDSLGASRSIALGIQLPSTKVMQKLIILETDYTGVLRRILDGLSRTPRRLATALEDLYFRHKVLLLSLTKQRGNLPVGIDGLVLQLLHFWCDEELIHAYCALLKEPSDVRVNLKMNTDAALDDASGETLESIVVSKVAWKHVQFLRVYLKGVRDTVRNDPHLEHILSILSYLTQHRIRSTALVHSEPPAQSTKATSTSEENPKMDQETQTTIPTEKSRKCRVEFIEGMALVQEFIVVSGHVRTASAPIERSTQPAIVRSSTLHSAHAQSSAIQNNRAVETNIPASETTTLKQPSAREIDRQAHGVTRRNSWKNEIKSLIRKSRKCTTLDNIMCRSDTAQY